MAYALDANNSIFPLAFGIVDSENDASWEWFFTKLRLALNGREHLIIVSDRHISIEKAVSKVYPEADFGICTHHLWNNLTSKFKKIKSQLKMYYYCVSRTYLEAEFYT